MANSVEDYLIDGLSFKLKPGASYINERKSVTYHPSGSNVYTTKGTKLIKLQITGDQWLDPSTFRVAFDLVNMEGDVLKKLYVVGGPHAFFKRMRILCNGNIVEDIDDYARVHEMFNVLTPTNSRINDAVEGFGSTYDFGYYRDKGTLAPDGTAKSLTNNVLQGIDGNNEKTVLFEPLSGLLSQPKYIPLRYCPITVELELIDTETEPIISDISPGQANSPFTAANTSRVWEIRNVMVKCDVCTLDNALDNSYAEHLLSGKSLPINYNTYISQMQSLLSGATGQKSVRLNITRSLSRLKSVFVTLFRSEAMSNDALNRKRWNTFYSTMKTYIMQKEGEFEYQLQIGSKLFPEYPIRSHAEGMYQLRKTVGSLTNNHHTIDIDFKEYLECKFILGIDTEKVLEAGFTGLNTRSGDILNIRFDSRSTRASDYPHEMHIILHSDNILEVRDSGITIFD